MKKLLRILLSIVLVFGLVGVGFISVHFFGCQVVEAACDTQSIQSEILAPNYMTYSSQVLQEAQTSNEKVVLYFWAPWCTSCTGLDAELLNGEKQIPDDVVVLRIDYDTATQLKQKYQVVTQHTFVQVDQNGDMLSGWIGGDIENFAKYLK